MIASTQRPWKAIAAMSDNRVIGYKNQLPWNVPEDFAWLKQATRGKAIAMGRLTFESMGRPLPHRENIVISRSLQSLPGCTVLPSLAALLQHPTEREIWIFGGAQIYQLALPYIHSIFLTHIKGSFEGDAFFPHFEDQFQLAEILRDEPHFSIRRYDAIPSA